MEVNFKGVETYGVKGRVRPTNLVVGGLWSYWKSGIIVIS